MIKRIDSRWGGAIALFAGLLALGAAVLLVLGVFDRDTDAVDALAEGKVSWLYSQTADGGELIDLGEGSYRLVMRGVDPHTIQFSDRPDRLVKIIDTAQLVDRWDVLFADSAPNAVLVEHEPDGTTDSIVVVLTEPRYDMAADELSYAVRILADLEHPERVSGLGDAHLQPPVIMRFISLFIDSVEDLEAETPLEDFVPGAGAEAVSAALDGADLGGGTRVISTNATANADGTVSGTAVVSFADGAFTLDTTMVYADAQNWTLTAGAGASPVWSPSGVPSLTIDPSTFTGTVSMSGGAIAYDLTGGTHTWQIANGATYVSTLVFSSNCPLEASKCAGGVAGPFLSMNGKLTMSGLPNPVSLEGAMTMNASWMRFDGAAGDLKFSGTGVTNTALTIWKGPRGDSYDKNMDLPSLAKLNNGVDVEFCGGFTLTIPEGSNAATNGCVRWSPNGVVIGQVGVDITASGNMPSTGTPGDATADVKGAAWTDIAQASLNQLPSKDVVMAGVHVALRADTIVLAGKASLPGVAADALNINLRGATSLVFNVTGQVSANGFSLSAAVPTSIAIGSEPFRTNIAEITATIAVERGAGVSFGVGTIGKATAGYAPNTRDLATSVQLVAATKPQLGMSLSVNARGTPASADAGRDGLTASTRLSDPGKAQYVWPDQFGIRGMNLWNLTVEISYQNGSPALGYTSTTYLDPKGATTGSVIQCASTCGPGDWMVGTLGINVSYTNPCLAYGFTSASGNSGFAIDGGVMRTTSFMVGVAPDGCSIQSGTTQQSLPVGFFGFKFAAAFGDATVEVATAVSVDGFAFRSNISNLVLAGMRYRTVELDVTINDKGSEVFFQADMDSGMGSMNVKSDFVTTSTGMRQSLDASLTNWAWGKNGTVMLPRFHFSTSAEIPFTGGCASFTSAADGTLVVGSRTLALETAEISVNCNGVQKLLLSVYYAHTAKWNGISSTAHLKLEYPKLLGGTKYLRGQVEYGYKRHFSKKYEGRTFSKDVSVAIAFALTVNPLRPADSGFAFSGAFDADRVSGEVGCSMDPGGADFTCGGKLRLNPSWAGVYHFDWGSL
jgi:hypothetical protein